MDIGKSEESVVNREIDCFTSGGGKEYSGFFSRKQ